MPACATKRAGGGAARCAPRAGRPEGPADTHCTDPDGGLMVTTVEPATCDAGLSADDGGGAQGCPYGDTMFGKEGDDDDCKYHVTWSFTSLCQGSAPVIFTVKATYIGTNTPLTAAGTFAEVFTTTPLDAAVAGLYCDNRSSHIDAKNVSAAMTEGPLG